MPWLKGMSLETCNGIPRRVRSQQIIVPARAVLECPYSAARAKCLPNRRPCALNVPVLLKCVAANSCNAGLCRRCNNANCYDLPGPSDMALPVNTQTSVATIP